ncbi:MAG TPA: HlyD family efflux transporter periplasmic adaptor subunit [Candidatus Brocadiia bacterium]|nr:HlyD family efflux transporter periplasmic adaptor subunit [Candidatus Brocadiia bacterium]
MLTVVRAILVVVILAIGALGCYGFIKLRPRPKEVEQKEDVVEVKGVKAASRDVEVVLRAHGTAKPRNILAVIPEVAGKVVAVHPNLKVGNVIPKGETLIAIDQSVYKLQLELAETDIRRLESQKTTIQQSWKNDERRVELLRRGVELGRKTFARAKQLQAGDAAAASDMDAAEAMLLQQEQQLIAVENAIALYPQQLKDVEIMLSGAQTKRDLAKLSLEKTEIRSPFDARVMQSQVEKDQVVGPGPPILVLADDSALEISVSMDAQEFREWFPLKADAESAGGGGAHESLFTKVPNKKVCVRWAESPEEHAWSGRLARIERYDPLSRTVKVVIEVQAEAACSGGPGMMPLVEGMFCLVEIPGNIAEKVFRLPRSAVSFEQTVLLCEDGRLKTQPVKVARFEGESALISAGIKDGDVVVTSRLVSPLEGMKLNVEVQDEDIGG